MNDLFLNEQSVELVGWLLVPLAVLELIRIVVRKLVAKLVGGR